jgi:hypothetical protein
MPATRASLQEVARKHHAIGYLDDKETWDFETNRSIHS